METLVKRKLCDYALQTNELEQNKTLEKKDIQARIKYLREAFTVLIKNPGDDPLDRYIVFTLNKEFYSENESLMIEMELLKDLKKDKED
jgi:hypothetical protein